MTIPLSSSREHGQFPAAPTADLADSSAAEAPGRPFFCALYEECGLRPAMHWGFDTLDDYYHHVEVAHLIAKVNAPSPIVRKIRLFTAEEFAASEREAGR